MATLKELTSMKLHETITINIPKFNYTVSCIRVDGGWIYMYDGMMTFVPESRKDETVLLG